MKRNTLGVTLLKCLLLIHEAFSPTLNSNAVTSENALFAAYELLGTFTMDDKLHFTATIVVRHSDVTYTIASVDSIRSQTRTRIFWRSFGQ